MSGSWKVFSEKGVSTEGFVMAGRRIIETKAGMPQRWLSHPHQVHPDGGLVLFTEWQLDVQLGVVRKT